MPKPEQPSRGGAASEQHLPRPDHGHGHRIAGARSDGHEPPGIDAVDPHPSWLKRWRCLRAGLGANVQPSETSREAALELQDKIAHTPANTLEGLQAQVELISELAWNDVVATTARQLLAGIKRLQGGSGSGR
jgi:hypothetical protein